MSFCFGEGGFAKKRPSGTNVHTWPCNSDPMVTVRLWEMPFLPPRYISLSAK